MWEFAVDYPVLVDWPIGEQHLQKIPRGSMATLALAVTHLQMGETTKKGDFLTRVIHQWDDINRLH